MSSEWKHLLIKSDTKKKFDLVAKALEKTQDQLITYLLTKSPVEVSVKNKLKTDASMQYQRKNKSQRSGELLPRD